MMVLLNLVHYALTYFTAPSKQPEDLTPTPPPPATSRNRHGSMNSAKMNAKNLSNIQVVQEIPSAKDAGVLNPNTGFPEPLSPDRNTTLRHPDADMSVNASIEAEDLELTRSTSRRRFLHSRHHSQKSITKGRIDAAEAGVSASVRHADGSAEPNGVAKVLVKDAERNGHDAAPATNGVVTNPLAKDGAEISEEEFLRVEKERDEQGYSEGERKKGVLRKLHLHKV